MRDDGHQTIPEEAAISRRSLWPLVRPLLHLFELARYKARGGYFFLSSVRVSRSMRNQIKIRLMTPALFISSWCRWLTSRRNSRYTARRPCPGEMIEFMKCIFLFVDLGLSNKSQIRFFGERIRSAAPGIGLRRRYGFRIRRSL